MRHRPLESVLNHIEYLVKAGFKDIRFITPDSLSHHSDDGVHPDYARLEQALIAMHQVAGTRATIQELLQILGIHSYQLDDLLDIPAVEINRDAAIVQHLTSAVETVTGKRPHIEGAGPACDGWMFIKRGIPTVCGYGAKCGGVHGADEWGI